MTWKEGKEMLKKNKRNDGRQGCWGWQLLIHAFMCIYRMKANKKLFPQKYLTVVPDGNGCYFQQGPSGLGPNGYRVCECMCEWMGVGECEYVWVIARPNALRWPPLLSASYIWLSAEWHGCSTHNIPTPYTKPCKLSTGLFTNDRYLWIMGDF